MKNATNNRERAKLLLADLEAELEILEEEEMNSSKAGYGVYENYDHLSGFVIRGGTGGFLSFCDNDTYNEYDCVGGGFYSSSYGEGDGSKKSPYTQSEYDALHNNPSFKGGWVKDDRGNMYFGYKNGDRQNDINDHWRKVGIGDIYNCPSCACWEVIKNVEPGAFFGHSLTHILYHKKSYYNNYGECKKK